FSGLLWWARGLRRTWSALRQPRPFDVSVDRVVPILALGVAIDELPGMRPQQHGEADQLLHHVDDAIVIARGPHSPFFIELLVCLRDARLVGDRHHAHPPSEYAEGVDRVEGLGSGTHLH